MFRRNRQIWVGFRTGLLPWHQTLWAGLQYFIIVIAVAFRFCLILPDLSYIRCYRLQEKFRPKQAETTCYINTMFHKCLPFKQKAYKTKTWCGARIFFSIENNNSNLFLLFTVIFPMSKTIQFVWLCNNCYNVTYVQFRWRHENIIIQS